MPRKKSVKKQATDFRGTVGYLVAFVERAKRGRLGDRDISIIYETALIKLHSAFERLILNALVGVINNDTTTLAAMTGIDFPKHLTDEVCEYIVTGGGYFDFRGRNGLIQELRKYLPSGHYLLTVVMDPAYKQSLERTFALRNFAAHESAYSKRAARNAVGVNLSSAGSWLKRQNRFEDIAGSLANLAREIDQQAPY